MRGITGAQIFSRERRPRESRDGSVGGASTRATFHPVSQELVARRRSRTAQHASGAVMSLIRCLWRSSNSRTACDGLSKRSGRPLFHPVQAPCTSGLKSRSSTGTLCLLACWSVRGNSRVSRDERCTHAGIRPASVMTTVTSSGLATSYRSARGERFGTGSERSMPAPSRSEVDSAVDPTLADQLLAA